mmetsp:Transcript_24299/g.49900  ORF Transcript_24299/g.49900 Transcript_24299/m.49900 type:complete len:185 (-) Transcript_24299:1938-2492(-)
MWKSNVFLRPLTHRFLRGAVQLVGRVLGFVKEGLDGKIEFGENNGNENDASSGTMVGLPPYFWHERVEDIAMVTWELTILDTCMTHDYLEVIADTVCPTDKESRQSTGFGCAHGVVSRNFARGISFVERPDCRQLDFSMLRSAFGRQRSRRDISYDKPSSSHSSLSIRGHHPPTVERLRFILFI